MSKYKLMPIIEIFFKGTEDDSLISKIGLKHVPVEAICKIFGDELLTEGGGVLIQKKHEKKLQKLAGVKVNTSKCDAFIAICLDNDPSKY